MVARAFQLTISGMWLVLQRSFEAAVTFYAELDLHPTAYTMSTFGIIIYISTAVQDLPVCD
jgi:hypothetical protein